MAFSRKDHLARYDRLRARQSSTAWTADYQAGIRATRGEAPKISRPTQISKLNRFKRTLHATTIPERTAIILAAFNPAVFDLREQFALSPVPSPHPMTGHARFAGKLLTGLPGTVAIYDGLGALDRHPVVRVRNATGEVVERPDLLVADLILGVQNASEPYCLHWTIKANTAGFVAPLSTQTPRDPVREQDKFDLRMRIDRLYFAAAGIPTRDFAADQIDQKMVANLLRCFSWRIQAEPLRGDAALSALIVSTDLSSVSPHHLYLWCRARKPIAIEAFQRVLYGMVWDRDLRPDLFTPLLFDSPWPSERRDPLQLYASYFQP